MKKKRLNFKKLLVVIIGLLLIAFIVIYSIMATIIALFVTEGSISNSKDADIIFFELEGEVIGKDITYKLSFDGITVENIKGRLTGNTITGSLKSGKKQRMELPSIPPASASVQSFMSYRTVTDKTSAQYKVLNSSGAVDEGIYRKKGGSYFVALGSFYGTNKGQKYEIHFKQPDGSIKKISALLGDQKADAHTDEKNQYHLYDKSIVEFITARGTDGNNIAKTQSQINEDFGDVIAIYKDGQVNITFKGRIKAGKIEIKGKLNGKTLIGSGEIKDGKIKITGTAGGSFGSNDYIVPIANNPPITSPYGYRPNVPDYPNHTGVDFGASEGTTIMASKGGVVVKAGTETVAGKRVIINHGDGLFTFYGHMSKISVKNGQKVSQGQKIGEVGQTGYATGAHLHFEVRKGSYEFGNDIDPMQVLKGVN